MQSSASGRYMVYVDRAVPRDPVVAPTAKPHQVLNHFQRITIKHYRPQVAGRAPYHGTPPALIARQRRAATSVSVLLMRHRRMGASPAWDGNS